MVISVLSGLVVLAMIFNEALGSAPIMLAVAAWSIMYVMRPDRLWQVLRGNGIVVWLYPGLALLSALWSPVPGQTARTAMELFLTILLALSVARLNSPLAWIKLVFAVCGVGVLCSIAVQRQKLDGMTGMMNWVGIFGNKNSLAECASVWLLSALTILVAPGSWRGKMIALLALPLGAMVCLKAKSVAALVALGGAGTVFGMVAVGGCLPRRYRTGYVEGLLLACGVALPVLGVLAWSLQDDLLRIVGKDSTLTGRTLLWMYARHFIADAPVWGIGYQGFWVQGYAPAEILWRYHHISSRSGFHFHSIIYETLIETGWTGLCLALMYVADVLSRAVRLVRHAPEPINGFLVAYLVFFLILQSQGVDLFWMFDGWFFLFVMVTSSIRERCDRSHVLGAGAQVHNLAEQV